MGTRGSSNTKMRVIMYSAMPYEINAFETELGKNLNAGHLDVVFVSARLDNSTAALASGAPAVCLFANDHADAQLLTRLRAMGVKLIVVRYAGVSSVDVRKAIELGMKVACAPKHAPTSIAEYTVTMMLALNRKVHIAYNRVRDGNMALHGLVGFDMSEKTVGIIGTGKVGRIVARILIGFGCKVLAYDMMESQQIIDLGGKYVSMGKLLASSDILSLHAPLVPGTHHMIGPETLPRCKKGVHIVNTSRGGLIDVKAVTEALKSGQVGALGLDVYEGESSLFFRDHTGDKVDADFHILKAFPNVLITGHQSALTTNALVSVAKSTVKTLVQFHQGKDLEYGVQER